MEWVLFWLVGAFVNYQVSLYLLTGRLGIERLPVNYKGDDRQWLTAFMILGPLVILIAGILYIIFGIYILIVHYFGMIFKPEPITNTNAYEFYHRDFIQPRTTTIISKGIVAVNIVLSIFLATKYPNYQNIFIIYSLVLIVSLILEYYNFGVDVQFYKETDSMPRIDIEYLTADTFELESVDIGYVFNGRYMKRYPFLENVIIKDIKDIRSIVREILKTEYNERMFK